MLANKPFMQEQVVAYVDKTFSTSTFGYNVTKCKRDLGIIIDSDETARIQEMHLLLGHTFCEYAGIALGLE